MLAGVNLPIGFWPLAGLTLVALALDAVHMKLGWPRPVALHRQVPQQWGKLLSAPVVAGLYGARLGVGPLTMLTTWLWWAAMVGASVISVWAAVGAGAVFGASRAVVNEIAARRITAGGLGTIERLGVTTRRSWITVNGSTLVGLALMVLIAGGCVAGNDVVANDTDSGGSDSNETDSIAVQGTSQTRATDTGDDSAGQTDHNDNPSETTTGDSMTDSAGDDAATESSGAAAEADSESSEAASAAATWQPSTPEVLSSALIGDVAWFNRLTEPGADLYLDIDAASNRQPDPTEERPLLETRGYLGGWSRVFRNDTQDVVVAQVYEFATEQDASFYLEDGFITLTGHGAEFFDLESLVGVRGFRIDGADEIGPIVNYGLAYAEQNRWYLLTLTGDPDTATLDILIAAMEAQRRVEAE